MKTILYIAAWILLAALVIWIIYRYIKYGRRIKALQERVKVRKDLRAKKINLICAVLWIFIAGSSIYFAADRIKEIDSGLCDGTGRPPSQTVEEHREILRTNHEVKIKWYSYLLAFWAFSCIIHTLELTAFKYEYITAEGVYYPDDFTPAEKFSYAFSGEMLLLYHKRNMTPAKHPVPESEDRALLLRILEENYKPHGQNTI